MSNFEVIESRSKREELLNNSKSLMLVENYKHIETINKSTDYLTSKQVADYFEVDYDCIKKVILRHKEELIKNGLQSLSGTETKDFLGGDNMSPQNVKGGFIIGNFKFNNKLNYLINRRCLLNIAMLLTESKIAEKIRGILLDITENVLDNNNSDKSKQELQFELDQLKHKYEILEHENKMKDETIYNLSKLIPLNTQTEKQQTISFDLTDIGKDEIEKEILNLPFNILTLQSVGDFLNEKNITERTLGIQTINQLLRDNNIFTEYNTPLKETEKYFVKDKKSFKKAMLNKEGMILVYRLVKEQITEDYQVRR